MRTLFTGLLLCAGLAQATEVKIQISALDLARKGHLYVQLCEEKDFLKRNCRFQQVQEVKEGSGQLLFAQVPPGRWAAMAFHDENGNRRLDQNQLGIPLEGTGFSRNAKGEYGPPSFAAAAQDVSGAQTEIRFRMQY